jgi:hypothetical protein
MFCPYRSGNDGLVEVGVSHEGYPVSRHDHRVPVGYDELVVSVDRADEPVFRTQLSHLRTHDGGHPANLDLHDLPLSLCDGGDEEAGVFHVELDFPGHQEGAAHGAHIDILELFHVPAVVCQGDDVLHPPVFRKAGHLEVDLVAVRNGHHEVLFLEPRLGERHEARRVAGYGFHNLVEGLLEHIHLFPGSVDERHRPGFAKARKYLPGHFSRSGYQCFHRKYLGFSALYCATNSKYINTARWGLDNTFTIGGKKNPYDSLKRRCSPITV